MPNLSEYLSERKLPDVGRYAFSVTEISAIHSDDASRESSVAYKGTIGGEHLTVFRYLHEKMLWQIADDLQALGVAPDEDVPNLDDADQVAQFMSPRFLGTWDLQVLARNYTTKEGETREDRRYKVKGYANASSVV